MKKFLIGLSLLALLAGCFPLPAYPLSGGGGHICITLNVETATTSGTSHDYTDIPEYVQRITIMFAGVSTNGTSGIIIQLGDSGGFETSGYLGSANSVGSAPVNHNTGFITATDQAAVDVMQGSLVLTLEDNINNVWTIAGILSRSDAAEVEVLSGTKPLSSILTQVRLTTVNGTDAFDAGAFNISYE